MTQISSSFTAFNKWVFPVLWLGFLVFFVADSFSNGTVPQEPMALLAPVFMAGIGLLSFAFSFGILRTRFMTTALFW